MVIVHGALWKHGLVFFLHSCFVGNSIDTFIVVDIIHNKLMILFKREERFNRLFF